MAKKERIRGFEVVTQDKRTAFDIFVDKETKAEHKFARDIKLPTRADDGSAGYDFYSPIDIMLLPAQKTIISTDVKAYMQPGEVLLLFIRSSLAVKSGIMLSNNVGVVDASYYSNEGNDGNIGIAVVNTSGTGVQIKKGDRIAQGIFVPYLVADVDDVASDKRVGGFGSSGE